MIENIEKRVAVISEYLSLSISKTSIIEWNDLEKVADIKYGVGMKAAELTNDYPYKVYGGNGIIGTLPSYTHEDQRIIISCRGAGCGNVYLTLPKSTVTSNSLWLKLKQTNQLLALYVFLKNSDLSSFITGSAQPQITIDNIKKLKVPLFNDNSLFVRGSKYWMKHLVLLEQQKQKLLSVKTTLLKKYF